MSRHIHIPLTLTFAAAILAMGSGSAFAEGPIESEPSFVSTRSRAEVVAELMGQPELMRAAASEWALQQNQWPETDRERAQARAEYLASRDEVRAMTAEDSGSSYLAGAGMAQPTATMGAPGR